jgi:hypothetical protein
VFVNAFVKHSVSKHILKGMCHRMGHPYVAPIVQRCSAGISVFQFLVYQTFPEIDGKLAGDLII